MHSRLVKLSVFNAFEQIASDVGITAVTMRSIVFIIGQLISICNNWQVYCDAREY